jgi:hypothetical protein
MEITLAVPQRMKGTTHKIYNQDGMQGLNRPVTTLAQRLINNSDLLLAPTKKGS